MTLLLANIGIGCVLGAALGYYGQCTTGTCPLTSTWWRGAIYGGVMGLVFYILSGNSSTAAMNKSTKHVAMLAEKDFNKEVIQSAEPVLVDFFATWCGPCKALAPVVDDLAGQFAGQIKFVKVNADDAPALVRKYHIEALPTLLLFQNGKVIDSSIGMQSFTALHAKLSAVRLSEDTPKVIDLENQD